MRIAKCIMLCIAISCLTHTYAYGYGIEDNAGLRRVEAVSPIKLKLLFGAAFGDYKIEERHLMYQIVSATDKDFIHGVGCAKVVVIKTEPDGNYPEGWNGPQFKKYTVEADLPEDKPMKDGHRYWIRLNSSLIVAFHDRGMWITKPNEGASDLEPRYGIREHYILSPQALHVITGPGIDTERLKDLTTVSVTSPDDPDFTDPVNPVRIGRRSNLDFYIPKGWPWKFHQRHELFLLLPKSMKQGKTYVINLNAKPGAPVTCGRATAPLQLDDSKTINLSIKVNQLGYLPEAKKKYAYLGMWMGDQNAYDFTPFATTFEIRNSNTHKPVLTSDIALRKKATFRLEDGKRLPKDTNGTEGLYKQDLTYENVYQLDLSDFKEQGNYYVVIPGMGRSFSFRVDNDIYTEAWKTTMNGILNQRCGIELKEPWSKHYRPACHRNTTEYSTQKTLGLADIKYSTDGKKHDIWGGHHESGDHPKTSKNTVDYLFLLYDMNKQAFTDNQLNIPENNNGLPDLLDEAWWQFDLWSRLQEEDGGVRSYVETDGDMKEGETQDNDTLREFAFSPQAHSSYWYAANAAHASIHWRTLGKTKQADELFSRAKKAWQWAQAHPDNEELRQKEHDNLTYAAAMLLRATGDKKYDKAFKEHSVLVRDPSKLMYKYKEYNQILSSYYYASCSHADPAARTIIVTAFEREFKRWQQFAETTSYRYMVRPGAPNNWGAGGIPKYTSQPAMTLQLTQDPELKQEIRQWIIFSNDFSLGCHPMNVVFTVGLGQRYVTSGKNILQQTNPNGIIAGFQSEGPGRSWNVGTPVKVSMGSWPKMSAYPNGPWPDLYSYAERISPGTNEGMVHIQAQTAFAYGILMPATVRK